ncbi:MAG TPA: phosphate/phosphite/phosphonate ABC transporter substrate-binding protein [Rhodocyclaceae bacterium]|nr:phosphate/phosphite/phosphonate ABC transporter substrate-binding protein [Rhodocyclaceae bacterium]
MAGAGRLRRTAQLGLALLVITVAPMVRGEEVYSFGPATQRSPMLQAQHWNPILDYVSRRAGVKLVLKVAATGDQSSDATVRGDYDFVYNNHQFKPSAAAQGYYVILRPRTPDIAGQIVTLEDSPIRNISDLQGHTVGFANPQGFTGYTVQMDQLMREKITVQPVFGGSQEGIMGQLKAGSVIAAGVNSSVMREYAARENLRYRVLWQSPAYHDLAISVHPRVPKAAVMAIRRVFAEMADDPEGARVLEASAKAINQKPPFGFLTAEQRDYQSYLDFYRHSVFKGAQ